ncbi:amidase [Parvularcula oceani]|uniref:amidase n=1 Tax=Parvularcula oceani TaxID=1247963 RepID=UPI00068AFAF9|nr:amidase [Parvularcula oceani]
MHRLLARSAPALLLACTALTAAAQDAPPYERMTAAQLAAAFEDRTMTAEDAARSALGLIEARDGQLQAVLAVSPDALANARALDAEEARRGPLHGVPILIKDNIETEDMPTTAGSYALLDNDTGRDAPAVAKLRDAGAVILGKANLSEWANFRSTDSISGWSGIGGQTRNPHSLNRTPCGSSSGSGAAVAAGYVPAALGSETNGSVICPSAANGIVGFKPTVGMISRTHVVPISHTQDTIGPMTRSVADAALLLSVMAGSDEADPATAEADGHLPSATLEEDALEGLRVGVMRFAEGDDTRVSERFEAALETLKEQGAELIEIEEWDAPDTLWADEFLVLQAEFKAGLNAYLADAAPQVEVRSLEELIAFNAQEAEEELPLFGQDILEDSQATGGLSDEEYKKALPRMLTAVRDNGIESLLAENEVDILVAPTSGPAFLIDPVSGDHYEGGIGAGWMAAMAGTPHLTVPMGMVQGLPVGLSFFGAAWDDERVLAAGADYEAASRKLTTPTFRADAFAAEETKDALARDRSPFEGAR